MDLNRLNKFVDSARKASSIGKARSSFINEVKNLKEGYRSQLLEAREPITKLEEKRIESQKKSDDERQDKLMTQLQDNQRAITSELRDIKFDRQALLEELPRSDAIEHPEYKKKPPIPPKPKEIFDADKSVPEYKELYFQKKDGPLYKNFPKPSAYKNMDKIQKKDWMKIINDAIKSWNGKTNTNNEKDKNLAIYQRDSFLKYKKIINVVLQGYEFVTEEEDFPIPGPSGEGLRKYNQPKRNAYKIQNSHYGGLLVDYPKLMNNMLIDVYKDNKLVYQDKADRSLIDLLTKRYNPKTKYSIDVVRIFNDLNLLANMPNHKSSKKSNMIGSSLFVDASDPNKLAKRLEIIVGSIRAGNNSRILKNDLNLINNELFRIGAITKEMHDEMVKKFINKW